MCVINQRMNFEVKGEYFSLGLKYGELLLYAMIKNYNDNNSTFYASNKYLSTIFDTSERTIQTWLRKLKDMNLIKIYFITNSEGYTTRFIDTKTQKSA